MRAKFRVRYVVHVVSIADPSIHAYVDFETLNDYYRDAISTGEVKRENCRCDATIRISESGMSQRIRRVLLPPLWKTVDIPN